MPIFQSQVSQGTAKQLFAQIIRTRTNALKHKFEMGMFQTAAGPMYVNPGIGYFFANVRFCCRPEVTVFEV